MVSGPATGGTEPARQSPQSSQAPKPPTWLASIIASKKLTRNAVRGDSATVDGLIGDLQHVDSSVRLAAARSLAACAERGDQHVISALLNMQPASSRSMGVDDVISDVRISSVETIGKIAAGNGKIDVCRKLLEKLRDEDWAVRQAAVAALAAVSKCDDNTVLGYLMPMLKENEWWAKVAASQALGRVASRGNCYVVEYLLRILKDEDWAVRKSSCVALSRVAAFGDSTVVDALLGLLEDADWRVRKAAIEAIGEVADEGCEPAINGLMSRLLDKHIGERKLLDTPSLEDCDVKSTAVKSLIRVARPGDQSVIDALRRLCQRDPSSQPFVQDAITGLTTGLGGISLST